MGDSKAGKVEIFHRVNKLKMKAGLDPDAETGFIDPNAVARAQKAIDSGEERYTEEIEVVLTDLTTSWSEIKTAGRLGATESLYHAANHIKDLASTYGYDLMLHFGVSLRDFIEKLDVAKKAHQIIVQAHIDVMWVAYKENIKDQEGQKQKAEELKLIVAKAIEKYS